MGPIRQVVHSRSRAGVLRAMHAHKRQTDVWHFTEGRAQVQTYDVLTGEWQNIVLDADHTILIPPGVSHGFLALTDVTLTYYLTEEYDGTDEYGWNALDKKWPGGKRWRHKDIFKRTWLPNLSSMSYLPSLAVPQDTPFALGDLIRSQRDLEAPSLGEFKAAW